MKLIEAKSIMNDQAIDTCPRRRQAIQEIKKHAAKSIAVKVKRLTHSVVKVLKEICRTTLHHEEYMQTVTEAIHELIKAKFIMQSRSAGEIHIAEDGNEVSE